MEPTARSKHEKTTVVVIGKSHRPGSLVVAVVMMCVACTSETGGQTQIDTN